MYLNKERTKESYFEKISVQAKGTQRNARFALKKFEDFVESRFDGRSSEDIISELLVLKDTKRDSVLFDLLQDYVNYMYSVAIVPNTIHNYFSMLKGYLTYRGLKIHQEEVKQNIKFPKIMHEEKHGLTIDEVKKILDYVSPKRKALYLTLLSSGMRIEETCALRKRDFDDSLERIQIHLPATYTKTKKARTTFVSDEAAKYLKPILGKINPDRLVFGVNEDKTAAKLVELNHFGRLRKRAGLTEKYGSGVHKITIHSFRAWFITRCSAINENVGHALAGHEYYMKSYDRLSNEEKLKIYLKVEPSLGIYSQTLSVEKEHKINEDKIKSLEENAAQLTERLEKQETTTAELQLIYSKTNEILNRETNSYNPYFPDGGPFDNKICTITNDDIALDTDGDGIFNQVDIQPNTFSNDFSDSSLGGTTFGTITTRGDQTLTITEEPNPSGVRIKAAITGGTTQASVSVCGSTTLSFSAGDEVIVTCGSVIVEVIAGQVEAVLDANTGSTTTATLSVGDTLTFEPLTFTLQSNSGTPSIMLVAPDSTVATFDLPTGNSVTIDPNTSAITAAETNPDTIVVVIGEEQQSLPSGSTVFADTTPPDITFSGSINDGDSFYFGNVPASPTCSAFDDISGVSGTCTVTGYSTAVGTHTLTATATDNAGNVGTSTITYHVLAWTISGFYPPVDMGNVLNTVNSGKTVPMKFEVFKGTTELTDTAIATLSLTQVTCGSGMLIDNIEITSTGNTSLTYDTAGGQFIYKWKTPDTANVCYDVVLTTSDTSTITAHFKLT